MSAIVYYFLRSLAVILSRLLVRLQIEGADNLPRKGPAILVVNHVDIVDPPVLVISTRRHIFFMAKEELFSVPVFGGLMRTAGTISVRRKAVDRQALRAALNVLERGGVLGLFPEGTRSKTDELLPFKKGGFIMAIKAQAPIVPVAVQSGRDAMRKGSAIIRPVTVSIRVGQPIETAGLSVTDRDALIVRAREQIAAMLAEGPVVD